jgi:hypothetical protein
LRTKTSKGKSRNERHSNLYPGMLKKTQEMLNDNMVTVCLSIADEAKDKARFSPPSYI